MAALRWDRQDRDGTVLGCIQHALKFTQLLGVLGVLHVFHGSEAAVSGAFFDALGADEPSVIAPQGSSSADAHVVALGIVLVAIAYGGGGGRDQPHPPSACPVKWTGDGNGD